MEVYKTACKNKHDIWLYSILIITASLASLLSVHNIIISSDSIRYGLVSQELLAGNGLRIPVIGTSFGFDNMIPDNGTVPFIVQPPLLPIVLALLGGIAPYDYLVAQILNAVCHVAISVFTFLLMRYYCNNIISLITGILVSLSIPMLWNAHHLTSESLFIGLTAAAIYYLTVSRNSEHYRRNRTLLATGIFTSAAIMTRYAGIALLAVLFWEAFLLIKNKKRVITYKYLILTLTVPVFTLIILFARNYLILGTLRGIEIPPPERSYLESLTGTIKMLFMQFHLGPRSSIVAVSIMMLCIIYIALNNNARREVAKHFHSGLDIILIFIASYTSLIYITLAKEQPHFEFRYVSPLAPFLFIITVYIIVSVWECLQFKRLSRLSLYGTILSLAVITLTICYKTYLVMPEFFYKQEKVYSIIHTCIYDWIKKTFEKHTIIATNKPFRLSFFGGYSTIVLPNRKYVLSAPIPEDMENMLPERMSEVGAEVLALIEEVKDEHFGNYVADLFNKKESNNKFILTHECNDGVIYTLKE
jgi:hypothetical protein